MSVTPSPFPVGADRPRRRGGRTSDANILPVAPGLQAGGQISSPSRTSRRQVEDCQHVRPGARDPASVDGVGHNASRDRTGKVEQPGRQEIRHRRASRRRRVDHVECLAHQLVRVLAQTRRGSDQRLAQAPADRALQAGYPAKADGIAQEPRIGVRGIRSRSQMERAAERLHVVPRHVDQRVHPGAGHRRDAAHPAIPLPVMRPMSTVSA